MSSTSENIANLCISVIPSWNYLSPYSISFKPLSSMTNTVKAVFINDTSIVSKGIEPSKVILRLYPNKPNRLVNRAKENAVFNYLADSGKGIKIYHCNPKYRIEEFFDGKKITVEELHNKNLMKQIAKALFKYNQDKGLFEIISQFDTKTAFSERLLYKWKSILIREFKTYECSLTTEQSRSTLQKLKYLTTSEFEDEYKTLLQELSETELVASHCDIHAKNMLRSIDNKEVILIDYEYTTVNYRAMDIATLFIETAIDNECEEFPFFEYKKKLKWSQEELEFFVRSYLEYDTKPNNHLETKVSKLLREVRVAEPLVSALWAIWSLIIADWKNFDETKNWNLKYAELRFDMYQQSKNIATS